MAGRTRASSNSPTGHGKGKNAEDEKVFTYESLMGGIGSVGEGVGNEKGPTKAVDALSSRLTAFRDWLTEEAGAEVHPSICIVNGEATDGTKNAPVLAFGPPPGSQNAVKKTNDASGRAGLVDSEVDRALYDRTMGCQVRTAKEIKKDELMMTMPKPAMVTPDLVGSSDAGRAVLACCQPAGNAAEPPNFWDAFENSAASQEKFTLKVQRSTGAQLLVKILQERKRAESALSKALQKMKEDGGDPQYTLAKPCTVTTRAAFFAFLIHQRFSNNASPPVSSDDPFALNETKKTKERNASTNAKRITSPAGSPISFAPYVRTFPSSVSLPLSWQRNELALLAGCFSGTGFLQEIASTTLLLAADFIALLDAGILFRFPKTFPPGLITWERWVWAASCHQSRILPVTCYLNEGESRAAAHRPQRKQEFQSPAEVWDELGVMVPLLDMINHEVEAYQVTWKPCVPSTSPDEGKKEDNENEMEDNNNDSPSPHPPRAIVHKRVRKGSQVYLNYGSYSNHILLLQYGFAQLGNLLDNVRLGWGLGDGVGGIDRPSDYQSPYEGEDATGTVKGGLWVSDTMDQEATKNWWTDDRLLLLQKEAFNKTSDTFFPALKSGKKMQATASSDGTYDPILLTIAAIATMNVERVKLSRERKEGENMEITKLHQQRLRSYLTYTFSRKLEKLLQNLSNGLKDHFKPLSLWTKATEGGLRYNRKEIDGVEPQVTGWQAFFEAHAYNATLEAENRYYAMGAESCVLTLFDGQLRSLQASIDGLDSEEKFREGVLQLLEDLDFTISNREERENDQVVAIKTEEPTTKTEESTVKTEVAPVKQQDADENLEKTTRDNEHRGHNRKADRSMVKQEPETQNTSKQEVFPKDGGKDEDKTKEQNSKEKEKRNSEAKSKGNSEAAGQKKKEDNKKSSPSKSSRRRNKRKNAAANNTANNHMNDRPPAIKLHIGNLAYSTSQATLYEFFAAMCGRESVLECHIPTERDTGRSRGFGFVTLPEHVARQMLRAGKKHEVDGRPLKIAESNSAGSGKSARPPMPPPMAPGDRCGNCGYSPKYCVCRVPSVPGFGPPPPPPPPPHMHPHGPPMEYGRDYYGGGGGGRLRDDRFGQNSPPYNRPRPSDRERLYGREPDRGYHHHRERSPSRSNGRGESRLRESRRDRRERERSRSRSRSPRGRRGRERDSDRRWGHRRSGSRSGSRSYSSGSSRSPLAKRDHDSVGPSRKDKKSDIVGGKDHNEDVRGANTSSSGSKPRDSRKRSHSRGGGGRRKKKDRRRSTRSRSRSRSRSGSLRGG